MPRKTFSNPAGVRFYVEPAADFADDGRMIKGRGVFCGIIEGNADTSGVWFPDEHAARMAALAYAPSRP